MPDDLPVADLVTSPLDRRPLLAAVLVCALASAILLPLHAHLALVNVAMLLLLVVALVAAYFGRGPAILASFWNVLLFDLGFVPPRGSLSVQDAEYLIVFAVMLTVALLVSQISGHLRSSHRQARAGERRQRQLYQLAADLNRSLRQADVLAVVSRFLRDSYAADVRYHLDPAFAATGIDAGREAAPMAAERPTIDPLLRAVERTGTAIALNEGDVDRPWRILQPMHGATRVCGILDLRVPLLREPATAARADTFVIVAGLAAAALERLHYLEAAARTQADVESERLRNALLASLSHDLRTPLTVLYGRADALREAVAEWPALEQAAAAVCDEALRANRLCESLLDLARLRSSPNGLARDWVALEELVGSAIASLQGMRGVEQVVVDLPEDLPWLQLDALMFARVFANLIDNALKQGGEAQRIDIGAQIEGDTLCIWVRNSGSRFPPAPERLLDAFVRGDRADGAAGFGVGLAICQTVVQAHGGRIELGNRADAAEVRVVLPRPHEPMPELPDSAVATAP